MSDGLRLLHIEDSEDDAFLISRHLEKQGMKVDVRRIQDEDSMRSALEEQSWDVILSDYMMPTFNGIKALEIYNEYSLDIPFIVVSGAIGEEFAVDLMKSGAHDYIMKENLLRLGPAIEKELKEAEMRRKQRQAQKELDEERKRLKEAQSLGNMGSWEYDLENDVMIWAEETYALYEKPLGSEPFSHEEQIARFGEYQVNLFRDYVEDVRTNKKELRYNMSATFPDGRIKYFLSTMRPIENEEGKVVKIFGIVQDISDQVKADIALGDSEHKFSEVFYASPNPMVIVIPDTGLVFDANQAFLELTGYDRQTCVDNIIVNLELWLTEKENHQMLELLARKESIKDFETEIRTSTQEKRFVMLSFETIFFSEFPYRIVSFTDITANKEIQQQLIVTDRLASIGELAAGIAHELNNPLTGVVGFSDLLMARKDIPADIREDLETINMEAVRASQVARNLLTFARRHPNEKVAVNLQAVITNVLKLRSYEQTVNNIEVTTSFDNEYMLVHGNEFQLQQVFLNIIINAEHFMIQHNGGGLLTITGQVSDTEVKVIISDNGPGISPEIRNHIFDPFFTTKDVGQGTGLGLSICYGIISDHGGNLSVTSELGEGATFIIELPLIRDTNGGDD